MVHRVWLLWMMLTLFGLVAYAEGPQLVPLPEEMVVEQPFENGTLKERKVRFLNRDEYWIKQFTFEQTSPKLLTHQFTVPGKEGTFKYVAIEDGNRVWKTVPLSGNLPLVSGFIDTTEAHWYISYPTLFEVDDQLLTRMESYRAIPVYAREQANGYTLTYSFYQRSGMVGEMWAVSSQEKLVPWEQNPNMEPVWSLLDMSGEGKWTWDGMYLKTPSSYEPTGVFYRFPDNYIARSFVRTGGSLIADHLGWVMLKQGVKNQNEAGYWPTGPKSTWLWKDYQIGAGFFDTRFNTDFARLLLDGYAKYGDEQFLESSLQYSKWLMNHANTQGVFMKKDTQWGVLVPDYAHASPHKKTHASLNHQLSEINYFFDLFRLTNQSFYQTYALNMINGIKWTREQWVKPNGDLEYGLLGGKGMGVDYPYLTYNDLWETQQILHELYGALDPDLAYLMEIKKQWMDKQGIVGYKK
ncbi:hypothetical protein [Ammoniphilus sp. YIM 78166]|uniref:hypothetical protein n=1 Tax=Ammoniphilus sp. YIM 78166 TaxID=1644106 RepID=UPI0010704EBA|nr:hypothetical protein [Ammoniphilus sp. YIM 78166]